MREVAAGNPVLVLQNLGLAWLPRWHYAVVVGFDLEKREALLRSGPMERHVTKLSVFERTWRRSGYWAVVITMPGHLPETADEIPYLEAVAALERLRHWRTTASAYGAALERWPHSLGALIGLANSHYALNDLSAAEEILRQATRWHPRSAPALNNLAHVLAARGKRREAEQTALQAVRLGGNGLAAYKNTLAQIREQHLNAVVP